jgi:hypothetical protein
MLCAPCLIVSLAVVAQLPQLKEGPFADALAGVANSHRIEIVHQAPSFPAKTAWGPITGAKATSKHLEGYAKIFAREFSLLPPSLIAKAKLKRVVLCEDLAFAGQPRNAVPDWEHDDLYLDVSRGAYAPRYLAAVIHHEFFHIVDFRDDGLVYRDDAWSALNPAGFKYGSGGKNWQSDKSTTAFTTKHPGFLTHYSTTGVEEDKAELYAHMIVNFAYVDGRAKTDPVLRTKVTRMKALLFSFCPDMNDEFWKKVEKMERPLG